MSCQCVCTCVRVWVVAAAAAAVALLEVVWELGSSGSVYREASRGRYIPVTKTEVRPTLCTNKSLHLVANRWF